MSEYNANSANGATEATEKKEVFKINLDTPVSFDPVADVTITSTNEIAKLINDLLKGVFKDYYGCNVDCVFMPDRQIWAVMPRLYFHVLPKEEYEKGGITAFRPLGSGNSNDMVERVQKLSQTTAVNGVKVTMTEEAKGIMEDFVILPHGVNDASKFNWNEAYATLPSGTETFIYMYKLDIIKFIKKLFGEKDENGSKLYYQVTPVYSINSGMQSYKQNTNWNINILRINDENQKKSAQVVGLGVPMYDNTPAMVKA